MNRPPARRVLALLVSAGLAAVVVGATWKWGVLPVSSWVDQRDEIARLETELSEIRESNEALQSEIQLLGTDAEIERVARRDFGLVYPGEEAYAILPRPVVASGG